MGGIFRSTLTINHYNISLVIPRSTGNDSIAAAMMGTNFEGIWIHHCVLTGQRPSSHRCPQLSPTLRNVLLQFLWQVTSCCLQKTWTFPQCHHTKSEPGQIKIQSSHVWEDSSFMAGPIERLVKRCNPIGGGGMSWVWWMDVLSGDPKSSFHLQEGSGLLKSYMRRTLVLSRWRVWQGVTSGGQTCVPILKWKWEVAQSVRQVVPAMTPLYPWEWLERAWARLHLDCAGSFLSRMFLVWADAHSKWMDVIPVHAATSFATIEKLKIVFAKHGLLEKIVTDNGTVFTLPRMG